MKEQMETQPVNKHAGQAVVFVGGTALLVSVWCLLFLRLLAVGKTAWGCISRTSLLGSLGAPSKDVLRILLDSTWSPTVVVGVSFCLFVVKTLRTVNRIYFPLAFAGLAFAFICADLILGGLAHEINLVLSPPRPLVYWGCRYTWPQILVTTILLFVFFLAQVVLVFRREQ